MQRAHSHRQLSAMTAANGDGMVNASDFALLAANYGSSELPVPALGALVPEPAGLMAIGLTLSSCLHRLRKSFTGVKR